MASYNSSVGLGNNYTLAVYFDQKERKVEENYSNVEVKGVLYSGNIRWESSYPSYLRVYWHDNKENYDRLIGERAMYNCAYNSSYDTGTTIKVYHKDDGTLSGYVYATFTKGGTSSYAPNSGQAPQQIVWVALDKINRIAVTNSVEGSDIESNFKVNYTKYINDYTYKLRVSIPNVEMLETIDYGTSGTTFTLSQTTISRLFDYTKNSGNTVNLGFAIETWNGNTKLSDGNEVKITGIITNANPIFSDFTFKDRNSITVALTGNDQYNINNYSSIIAQISTTNKAIAQKSATMVKYKFTISDKSIDFNYSPSSNIGGVINNAPNGIYNVYAIDSRNNSTLVTKFATQEIQYEPIYLDKQNCSVQRNNNQVGQNAILTLSGTIWNNSFGQVTNSIKSVTYQFKKTDSSTWITGTTTITPTVSGNTFTFTGQIASDNQDTTWDLDDSYNIKITVSDELSSDVFETILTNGYPTLSLDKKGVGIMCAYDNSLGGKLQVDGKKVLLADDEAYIKIVRTTDMSLSSGTNNLTGWTTEYSKNASYSSTNYTITLNKAGLYILNTYYHFQGSIGGRTFSDFTITDGGNYCPSVIRTLDDQAVGSGDPTVVSTGIFYFAAGTKIQLKIYVAANTTLMGNSTATTGQSYISLHKIGEYIN